MKFTYALFLALALIFTQLSHAAGLVSVASQNDVKKTVALLESKAKTFGFEITLVVNHANKATPSKQPGKLLLLEHKAHGGPLLALSETIGVDLPLKVFTFSDKKGQVWMTYPDPRFIAARHNISDSNDAERLADALSSLTLVAATSSR